MCFNQSSIVSKRHHDHGSSYKRKRPYMHVWPHSRELMTINAVVMDLAAGPELELQSWVSERVLCLSKPYRCSSQHRRQCPPFSVSAGGWHKSVLLRSLPVASDRNPTPSRKGLGEGGWISLIMWGRAQNRTKNEKLRVPRAPLTSHRNPSFRPASQSL